MGIIVGVLLLIMAIIIIIPINNTTDPQTLPLSCGVTSINISEPYASEHLMGMIEKRYYRDAVCTNGTTIFMYQKE
jgi:hypothetical protein